MIPIELLDQLASSGSELSEAAFARELHSHVRDLIAPKSWLYWGDMLSCVAVGYTGLGLYLALPALSFGGLVGYLLAAFALYRGLMFIHELAHLPRGKFGAFRTAWNALLGVPFLTPSFLYAEHRTHHVNHSYGTYGDSEYAPVGRGPLRALLWFLGQGPLMPLLAVVRFGLLTPVSLLHPAIRRVVWQRASGLTQNNEHFRRPPPSAADKVNWGLQEAGCFLVIVIWASLFLAGVLPWEMLLKLYLLFGFITTLSYIRALSNHLYYNDGPEMTYLEQMLDSTTIPGHPLLTELWAPLGQRFHALHHLIPSLPYHALGTAHRRLMIALPENSPYRQTIVEGMLPALRKIYHQARVTGGRSSTEM